MDHGGPKGTHTTSLLAQLPGDVVESLSPDQRAALWEVSHSPSWQRYPVNIRFSVPIFTRRFFITIVAGNDRRSGDRATAERRLNPMFTLPNVLFLTSIGAFFATSVALFVLLVQLFSHLFLSVL